VAFREIGLMDIWEIVRSRHDHRSLSHITCRFETDPGGELQNDDRNQTGLDSVKRAEYTIAQSTQRVGDL
jgi:hypothetical protein